MGAAVATTMLSVPLLLALVPAQPAAPEAAAEPTSVVRAEAAAALQVAAMRARDEAQASRGRERTAPAPSVAPQPSVAATPAAPVPSVTPEPTPAAPPVVTAELWVTTDVNVRSGPSAGTDRVGYLSALDQVGTTGTTEGGWTQVVVDGAAAWVNSDYLSDTEPQPEPEPEPEAEAEDAPAAASGTSDASCSINPGIEPNLSGNARAVYRAVCAAYGGSVSGFGGYRPGDGGDHGSGRAVDVMVSGSAGWEISRFLQDRAGELGITYLIYEQQIWMAGSPAGAWEFMEDRGGATANHFDHVHVSVG